MTVLPKHIQQQVQEANEFFNPPENPEAQAPAPEEEETLPDAPDAVQPDETEQKPEPTSEHSQEDTEEPKRSEAYWEHRFRVMEGKYVAEVPPLRAEVEKLTKQLTEKDREIQELKSSTQSTNPGGLTDEQLAQFKEEFGEDLVSFIERMTAGSAKASPDTSKVSELEQKLAQIEERDRQNMEVSFWTALTELVPDWKELNANSEFLTFLAQYDPQTGKQRQASLDEARQALDADGVATIFNAFKKQQPPAPQKRTIPEDQIDPRTTRTTNVPEAKKIWTRDEITQFYKDKVNRKYAKAEAEALEADIFAAQVEGRIR